MKALLVLLAAALAFAAAPPQDPAPAAGSFEAWDVFVDSHGAKLGAWQFEWLVPGGGAHIVGVEGGEHPAFAPAPYHDPAALQSGRIVVAAFSTANELPRARTRVARLHLHVDPGASPRFEVRLMACADDQGAPVRATITRQETEKR